MPVDERSPAPDRRRAGDPRGAPAAPATGSRATARPRVRDGPKLEIVGWAVGVESPATEVDGDRRRRASAGRCPGQRSSGPDVAEALPRPWPASATSGFRIELARARAVAKASSGLSGPARGRKPRAARPGHGAIAGGSGRSAGSRALSVARAIVSGALANKPRNGGEAWVRLSWVLGLRAARLRDLLRRADRGRRLRRPGRREGGVRRLRQPRLLRIGRSTTSASHGPVQPALRRRSRDGRRSALEEIGGAAADADVLVQHQRPSARPEGSSRPRARAFVDLDPGYTQVLARRRATSACAGTTTTSRSAATSAPRTVPCRPAASAGDRRQPVVMERWARAEERVFALHHRCQLAGSVRPGHVGDGRLRR